MKVLFISAWYPNRYDEMAGLFVRKHAQAVSQFCEVEVLYIHPSTYISRYEIYTNKIANIKETTVYFPAKSSNIVYKLIKQLNYLSAYYKGWRHVKKNNFTPDIIHANILTRTALMAFLIKLISGIPYVLTEHWSRYLTGNQAFDHWVDKWITQKIVSNASAVMPVSRLLMNGMLMNDLKSPNYQIVNNVVDENFYSDSSKIHFPKLQILHVSCFDNQSKNITGMLRALKKLTNQRSDFEVDIVGSGPDFEMAVELFHKLNFPKNTIRFSGEVTPDRVAAKFLNSDIFVLFSNYETAAVVIAESLVSGVPVVSTEVGIASEYIDDSNGILIKPGDENALTEALNFMIDNIDKYDQNSIKAKFRTIFSYENIGQNIYNIYKNTLN